MKKFNLTALFLAASTLSLSAFANGSTSTNGVSEIQKQYEQHLKQGKQFKDAYQALQYEIAYEQATMVSYKPCKKMVRGL